jgi:hypothetical protein
MTTRSVGTSYAPPSDRTRLSPSADEEQEGTAIITVAPTVVLVDRHPVSPAATAPAIEPALVVTRAPFSLLPDEIIIDHIFGFVGTGHYRYVAGTNRQFCNLYDAFLQRKDQEKNEADEKKTTVSPSFHCLSYFSCIVESISRTEMWLEETHSSALRKDHRTHVSSSARTPLNFIAQLAACSGSLPVLQWAHHTQDCDLDSDICASAAANGHLEVLQWARQNHCLWNANVCINAASNGHLEVLQWARRNDCDWNALVCIYAASNGHLQVLQWARQNGCAWDAHVCNYAALNGHLEVLQWARQNGCDWVAEDVCINAASNEHVEVLNWDTGRVFEYATESEHLMEVVQAMLAGP